MILHGIQILNPDYFYTACCLLCAVVALSIGSSWTVAGTLDIALVGISSAMGLDVNITAGAIIGGAYFGDKCHMSTPQILPLQLLAPIFLVIFAT
ncbi:hypothetical protein PEC18_34865 [Paucibacter sp. O1-1]|nr:hypothetical protein [Paucibacter sp. O1-1]MDA3830862.1 hypothetical protein [Paucibacter sp. O1-1]